VLELDAGAVDDVFPAAKLLVEKCLGFLMPLAEGLEPLLALLAKSAPGSSKSARRRKAVAAMAGLVGALLLARAIGKRELSDEILEATRDELLASIAAREI